MAKQKTDVTGVSAANEEELIAADELDVTLELSDEALEEIEKIEERAIEASQSDKKVFWR